MVVLQPTQPCLSQHDPVRRACSHGRPPSRACLSASLHPPGSQVFGHSPDETAFARIQLNREPTGDSMLMIQPTLYSFSFNGEPAVERLPAGTCQLKLQQVCSVWLLD